jgi:hypothetical protein
MRNLLCVSFFLCFSNVFASNPEKQVRKYIQEIEQSQKEIASLLVIQNFSRFMVSTVDDNEVSRTTDLFMSPQSTNGMRKLTSDFFDTVYSEKTDGEKIDSITKLLIRIRRSRTQWINLGSRIKRTHEKFFDNFQSNSELCSDKYFYESFAVLENFTPSGIDASQFRYAWDLKVEGNRTFFDDGTSSFNMSAHANGQDQGSTAADARHAAATTAGAVAMMAPPPWNIVGAVGLPLLIEISWGMIDMSKNMREMEKLAAANQDLFQALKYEINIKKYYTPYCNELERAYLELRPLILDINSVEGKKNLETMLDEINAFGTIDQNSFFKTKDNFYRFVKAKAIRDAVTIFDQNQEYFQNWNQVMESLDNFTTNIELALTQIISHRRDGMNQNESVFASIFQQIMDLNHLKESFTKHVLDYFEKTTFYEQQTSIHSMRILIENYRLFHLHLNPEEIDFLTSYEHVILKLEAKND